MSHGYPIVRDDRIYRACFSSASPVRWLAISLLAITCIAHTTSAAFVATVSLSPHIHDSACICIVPQRSVQMEKLLVDAV